MLQHAGGKRRLLLPNETFTVTINGKTAEFESVEIDATGALLMIFIDEDWAADKIVIMLQRQLRNLKKRQKDLGKNLQHKSQLLVVVGFNQVIRD